MMSTDAMAPYALVAATGAAHDVFSASLAAEAPWHRGIHNLASISFITPQSMRARSQKLSLPWEGHTHRPSRGPLTVSRRIQSLLGH